MASANVVSPPGVNAHPPVDENALDCLTEHYSAAGTDGGADRSRPRDQKRRERVRITPGLLQASIIDTVLAMLPAIPSAFICSDTRSTSCGRLSRL